MDRQKRAVWLLLVFWLLLGGAGIVRGGEIQTGPMTGRQNEDMQNDPQDESDLTDLLGDLSDIEAAVSEALVLGTTISFKDLLLQLAEGNLSGAGTLLWTMVK